LPLATNGDQLLLLAKDQITMVQYAAQLADTPVGGVEGASVDLVIADGTTCSGELQMVTRASRSRLLDFLNEEHQRFLTLRTEDGVCLVNCRQIAQAAQRH
jgi:hypothetical protein